MNKPLDEASFEIKDYRQPLVTSLGVILGFLIGFLAQWIAEPQFAIASASDAVLFAGCLGGAALLLVVLWRMLTPAAGARTLAGYRRTLMLYMSAIVLPFGCLLLAAFI